MKYYTLKKDVPLAHGQVVHFTKGKGYWPGPAGNNPLPAPHPPHHPPDLGTVMAHWALWGLLHQASFQYTQGPLRSQMFHTTPGQIPDGGMHADCSQFYASCGLWAGVKGFTDTDYTGTLLERGKPVRIEEAKLGDGLVWGPGTGEHIAMWTGRLTPEDGWCIGFGHSPGAPNRNRVSDMTAYFDSHGHPGLRVIRFA